LTDLWLSEIVGSRDSLYAYSGQTDVWDVTFYDLDDSIYHLTIKSISAVSGNYDYTNTYTPFANCTNDNFYRGYQDDGFRLGDGTVTLQDPMQAALATTLDANNLSCNVEDEVSLDVTVEYSTFPTEPALSNDWLVDAYIYSPTVFASSGSAATVDIYYNGTFQANYDLTDSNGGWLSEMTLLDRESLVNYSDSTEVWSFVFMGLDSTEYSDVGFYTISAQRVILSLLVLISHRIAIHLLKIIFLSVIRSDIPLKQPIFLLLQ